MGKRSSSEGSLSQVKRSQLQANEEIQEDAQCSIRQTENQNGQVTVASAKGVGYPSCR